MLRPYKSTRSEKRKQMSEQILDKPTKYDNRPLWLILLDRTARYQVMTGLALVMALLLRLSPPQGLSVEGYKSLVLFGGTIFLWISAPLHGDAAAIGNHGRQENLLHVRQ